MSRLEIRSRYDRDVNPLTAPQFDLKSSMQQSKPASTNTSPTSDLSSEFTNYSRRARSDSATSPITSVDSQDECCKDRRCFVSYDDWFAQQDAGFDLSGVLSDECPDRATLAAVEHLPIYDANGSPRPFGSLFDPATATHERQLLVFVRHFFCGACQAYLRALAEGIPMQDYFTIPVPTSIVVIGCGQPNLIPHYRAFSNCPFPIFADPSRKLFKRLGMAVSLNMGRSRPDYMRDISAKQWLAGQATTISQSLKDPTGIRKRDVLRGGNPMQIGGEFLLEAGQVIWCHRMTNYRNHAEVHEVRKVLGLDE